MFSALTKYFHLVMGWAGPVAWGLVPMEDDNDVIVKQIVCSELDDIDRYSDFYFKNSSGDKLNLFQTNIRSFYQNIDKTLIFLSFFIHDIDIVILCECWRGECYY